MKLTDVLRGGRQCDEEGVEIIMSRQACCMAADRIEELEELKLSFLALENMFGELHIDNDELRKRSDRLLVLATKHCPKDHHDWAEILEIAKND